MKSKLKKVGKFIMHNTFGFLIGILIAGTTVYAATVISGSSISYDNSNSTLEATNVQDALDELTSKTYQCPGGANDLCTRDIKVGDYVWSSTSNGISTFTIPASMTGYTSDQNINPSELQRFRIIDIKNDGTIDLISEYTSSTPVYFKGLIGIQSFVGTLNWIASQYINLYDAIDTRYIGYNGQVGVITASTLETVNCNYHYPGCKGGDTLYTSDTDLVESALGTLQAYKYGTSEYAAYWLASRYYYVSGNAKFWGGRRVNSDGSISYASNMYSTTSAAINPNGVAAYIRPIITIKADANTVSGSGTKASPWYLD